MRTFIAIDLSEGIKARLVELQDRIRSQVPSLSWVKPEQLHLTLKFLGEIDGSVVSTIGDAISDVTAGFSPFDLTLKGAGTFGPRDSASVVWVGIKDTGQTLYKLQADLASALEPLGFPREERPFKPHLTLARNKNPRQSQQVRKQVDAEANFADGCEHVESLTFYHSVLGREGPVYSVRSTHPLKGPGDQNQGAERS